MTIVNKSIQSQILLVDSLSRLANAIERGRTGLVNPVFDDMSDILSEINQEEVNKTIENLSVTGDSPRVSEELYNPSSTIFDTSSIPKIRQFSSGLPSVDHTIPYTQTPGDAMCTGKFLIVVDDRVVADIKNFHHVLIEDYTCTSLLFPTLIIDSLTSAPTQPSGHETTSPRLIEGLDTIAFVSNITFPYIVSYSTLNTEIEKLNSIGGIYSASYPYQVSYKQYAIPRENLASGGSITSISYPLTVSYIPYQIPTESINSSGHIYAIAIN